MKKVCVTGIGIVSGLGIGVQANANGLKLENTGVKLANYFGVQKYASPVQLSNKDLKECLSFPKDKLISRTALLGALAAKEVINNLNPSQSSVFINGSTVGGMDLSEEYLKSFYQGKPSDPNLLNMHDLGTVTEEISKVIPNIIKTNTISTACSSSANAIMIAGQLIELGKYDTVIAGGTDALCEFTMQGFKSLMVYSDDWCEPFSENRTGLNLGEGAAYLILESEESAKKYNKVILGYLSGWANANDAFHSTGTSPDGKGAQLAMSKALEVGSLRSSEIDYINAHGTATKNNDSSELAAMNATFGDKLPNFSSTKASTGHTLAAAGAIESVYSIISIQEQLGFANLNCANRMSGSNPLLQKVKSMKIDRVMSNSFGFGGNCTSLIFSKK